MLNLSGEKKYLPELSPGYEFKVTPAEDEAVIRVAVIKSATHDELTYARVYLTAAHTAEGVRHAVISKAEGLVEENGMWNPTYKAKIEEALADLKAPKDELVEPDPLDQFQIVKVGNKLTLAPKGITARPMPERGVSAPPRDPNTPGPRC